MNILLVTMEMHVGGAETHIFELAKELKKRGHNVYVMSAGGKYADLLEKEKIIHIYAPLKNKKITNMYEAHKIIKNVIEEKHIDIVHAHARIPGFISAKVCKKLKVPLVTTVHGIYKVNFLLKILTNWGQMALAVSDDIKRQIIRDYNFDETKINVTVNGINTDTFCKGKNENVSNELHINNEKFHIVHVSRLDNESSNVAKMLINIFNELKNKTNNNVQLIIVGDGNNFDEVKELKHDEEDIILTGLRTDVAEVLKCCDLFIGVSRASLEAMSCEIPVVLAGNKDYGQGFIGIFDEEKEKQAIETNFCCRDCIDVSENDLLDSILEIYRMNIEKRNELGKYGRDVVKKYYSIEKMADDAEKMYKEVKRT